jgi:GAF domain-containing protein
MPLADELSGVFARMSGLLLSRETVQTALRLVTSLAAETVPGAVGAGVTLMDERGRRSTWAATDPEVERADALQYELDEGPCLTAWADRTLVRVDDATSDRRWPRWADAVAELGLRSTMSACLVAGDSGIGAIKVYAAEPAAFDQRAEHLLSLFAAQAAILLANVQTYQRAQLVSDRLKEALRSRDLIGQAKGVLIGRDSVDEETAFATLVAASVRENRKLRDVAQTLVQSAARRRR